MLENFSGQAWQDVELTLLSGNPVTFRQALYESYYVPRPTVPVESGGRVLPPPDTGTVGAVALDAAKAAAAAAKAMPFAAARGAANMAMAAPASAARRRRRPRSRPPPPPRRRRRSPSPHPTR